MRKFLLCVSVCIFLCLSGPAGAFAGEVLFKDTFDTGTLGQWDVKKDAVSQWKVDKTMLGTYVVGQGPSFMGAGTSAWVDYDFSGKVRITMGGFEIGFRTGTEGRYYIDYNPVSNKVELRKNKPWDVNVQLSSAALTLKPGTWYSVDIRVVGKIIKVYVDGNPLIECTDDQDPVTSGGIQLICLDKSLISFDDIQVKNLAI